MGERPMITSSRLCSRGSQGRSTSSSSKNFRRYLFVIFTAAWLPPAACSASAARRRSRPSATRLEDCWRKSSKRPVPMRSTAPCAGSSRSRSSLGLTVRRSMRLLTSCMASATSSSGSSVPGPPSAATGSRPAGGGESSCTCRPMRSEISLATSSLRVCSGGGAAPAVGVVDGNGGSAPSGNSGGMPPPGALLAPSGVTGAIGATVAGGFAIVWNWPPGMGPVP
mmetsp:Transcript_106073/g.331740  ORF Transcript_106073/g.331740 Transcript_106073/m.331740 type:complete len:224 (-) Transcript_106073:85-756(-)